MSDRGMKKWAPYASLIEQKGTIRRMKHARSQSPKPLLSSDRAQELNEIILMSLGKNIIVQWYENGQIWMHTHSKENKREGEHKRWYENGQLMLQAFYKDGEEEGEYISYWSNGKVWTKCYCKNGKLDGEWEEWNEDGTLKEKIFYKNGEKQV
jgi:antitoxin component YwqK of YwqJK toxin-antitoxin module